MSPRALAWPASVPIGPGVLFPHVRPHLVAIVAVTVAGLGSVALNLAQPVVLERLISGFDAGVDYVAASLLAALIMARTLVASAAAYFGSRVANSVVLDLREAMVRVVLSVEMTTYVRIEFGDLIHRLGTDASRVRALLPLALSASVNAVTAVGAFVLMSRIDWALTVVVLAVAGVCAVVYQRLSDGLTTLQETVSSRGSAVTTLLERTVGAVKSIRSASTERIELARFRDAGLAEYRSMMKFARLSALLTPLTQVIAVAALSVAITFGAWRVASGDVELGSFVAFVVLCFMFMDSLSDLVDVGVQTRTCLVSARRVGEVLALPREDAESSQSSPLGSIELTPRQGALPSRSKA